MKRILTLLAAVISLVNAHAAEPLRVFIRGGKKSHGPEQHEHQRFLEKWTPLLTERGMKVDGGMEFPSAEQLAKADVLVMYAQDSGNITLEQRPVLETFIQRGGGIVVIHTASVANKPDTSPYWKSIIGGSWVAGQTKWKEGPMDLYFTENQRLDGGHPITKDASNFHFDDEIYYDMDISPDVRVLAMSYTPNVKEGKKPAAGGKANIYDIQPQMWTYEKVWGAEDSGRQASSLSGQAAVPAAQGQAGRPSAVTGGTPVFPSYRVFVSIPGHLWSTFERPNFRALLLRGIAWAGKRANLDEFCKPEEISSLTYPEGGPQKPEQTLANLEVHPDFTMKLVTAEPLITKPMNFDWDPAGRLWVAETPEYPNGRRGMRPDYRGKEWKDHGGIDPTVPEPNVTRGPDGKEHTMLEQTRKAQDKISILTSSKGDGVMDTKQVFYEGLELVTGFVFHKDGVIVTQAPDILFIHDAGPDGRARKVEKLYTGLGTSDTHAVINNPRWGWDGWIYATHGYSAGDVTSADGSKKFGRIGSGVVRFKPDGSAIEQYSSKGGNTWGLSITADNRVMWTQPTSGTLLNQVVLPEYALARGKIGNTTGFNTIIGAQKSYPAMSWEQAAYVQIDRVGDFTAAAGCAIYDGGTWPAEYNGDYFTTEPTINIIAHQRLTPKGSSYTAAKLPGREETEFVRSRDMWWRPIEARVGPDGALYIADFYNQAVIHNDTRGPDHNKVNAAVRPDRDHYFGRIWKIDHKDAKKIAVPDLSKASVKELVAALEHPNKSVRMTAARLLMERPNPLPKRDRLWQQGEQQQYAEMMEENFGYQSLLRLALDSAKPAEARIAALWVIGQCDSVLFLGWNGLLSDKDPAVRRNAALLAERFTFTQGDGITLNFANNFKSGKPMADLLTDSDAQVRLAALRALASCNVPANATHKMARDISAYAARDIVAAWPKFDDDFQKSAAVGALAGYSGDSIPAILDSGDASLSPLASILTQSIGERNDASAAAKLVVALADSPASADALTRSILGTLGNSLRAEPAMTPELSSALGKLLASGASGSALPLAAKWDKAGALKGEVAKLTGALLAQLADAKAADDARTNAANSLIGLRTVNGEILPAVIGQLAREGSAPFKRQLIAALGETGDASVGTALASAYGKLSADAQPVAFDTLLKRPEWALAFLDAVASKQLDVTTLGPASAARLRTHPDRAVSKRATQMLDELNPLAKAKKDAIAKLIGIVEQPGDAVKGKAAFTLTCAICHKFGDAGADVGPGLTGMGAHAASELLSAIVDPNAEVDPSFTAWNIETRDGQAFAGVIASENPASITLKSLAGVQEIKVKDIKTRVNTGRSLMPEGFEGLGGEPLRDIIAYMQSVDGGKFRVVDLRDAFTATTALGLYATQEAKKDSFVFKKTGTVNVEGVPFSIIAPEKAPMNIIVLNGGHGLAKTMPQKVEARLGGFKANRLHFLGGVTGWGFNGSGGDTSDVLKITVHYADGQKEGIVCRNGTEFADYIHRIDVPGSKWVDVLNDNHQMRYFVKPLARTAPIEKVVLESFGASAAPTLVAVTAELADANAPLLTVPTPLPTASKRPAPKAAPNPTDIAKKGNGVLVLNAANADEDAGFKPQFTDEVPQPPATRPANGPRVLIVGGGSSHDFVKFFGGTDKATLAPVCGWVDFTQNANGVPAILDRVDVLVWSANQPVSTATTKALLAYANRGGAIVAHHPGTWYAWKNFPEWNLQVVGGGTRGHDALGAYTVKVTNAAHPITKSVPASFEITDELYNYNADPAGNAIEVLAEATSPKTGKTFPQVFVVKHPKARIVGLTLGHDARAHDLPPYQTLLKNAVQWASGK
jgi:putative membrane-bound dehydrogenase-like protein